MILKYSKEGETVLDYFCGAGTTAVEAKLLGRKCIAFDINDVAIELAKKNMAFDLDVNSLNKAGGPVPKQLYEPKLFVGDARDLSFLEDNSIDLICAHPPYANIIQYTRGKEGDLSFLEVDPFLQEMGKVAGESYRVLKPGRQCAILFGDTRQKKHVVPIAFKLINVYLNAGFRLKELVIKRQHHCKTTGFWYANSIKYNFLLLAHEYLPIFEKPEYSQEAIMREEALPYGGIYSALAKPALKKELRELESTTVWIFPENDFERRLNENVIDRYSSRRRYLTLSVLADQGKSGLESIKESSKLWDLILVKSPYLESDSLNKQMVSNYLTQIKRTVSDANEKLTSGGFLVVQTRDIRLESYVEPIAKYIVDQVSTNGLRLREIIVVTSNDTSKEVSPEGNHLKIAHQYLLVYQKT